MQPFFSVVIPTLNEEVYLPRLLDCLQHQSEQEFEVIIVDGGSTDSTVRIAKKYSSKFEKCTILHSTVRNVGYQRNLGSKKARGEYIVFFDADVRIEDDFFQSLHTFLLKDPQRLVTTKLVASDNDVRKQWITGVANIGKFVLNTIGYPDAGGYNIIVKRSTFEQLNGFDESLYHAEDTDFIHRCYKKKIKLHVLEYPYQYYSFRRYETFGYAKVLRDYCVFALYQTFKGPIQRPVIEYPMGGQIYKKEDRPDTTTGDVL